jgi:hypothetical protein
MNNQYVPVDGFLKMTTNNIIWSAIGLVLGCIVDNTTIAIIQKYKIKNVKIQILIQLFLCSTMLSFLHERYNYFGWTWQNLTPGLFFVSFFFGTQFKLFNIVSNEFIMVENND